MCGMTQLLEPIFDATLQALHAGGIWAIFGLMILESMCIPAPSELIMLFAGYLVFQGDATMLEVVTAGVIGNVIGSGIAWAIGVYGGRPFIDRHGKWIRLNHHHLVIAERWFDRWGVATVFFTRNLPIIRTFISLPAGLARMPLAKFLIFTFLGCIPWVWGLAEIGKHMGPRWEHARDVLHRFDYAVILAIVLIAGWIVIRWWTKQRRRTV